MGTWKMTILPQGEKSIYRLYFLCLVSACLLAISARWAPAMEIQGKGAPSLPEADFSHGQGPHRAPDALRVATGIVNGSRWSENFLAKERSKKSDLEITEDIQGELRRSPFVDSHRVTVKVKDGIATLTGTVESWTEYADAEANAFQGGAKRVRNHLKVKEGPKVRDQK